MHSLDVPNNGILEFDIIKVLIVVTSKTIAYHCTLSKPSHLVMVCKILYYYSMKNISFSLTITRTIWSLIYRIQDFEEMHLECLKLEPYVITITVWVNKGKCEILSGSNLVVVVVGSLLVLEMLRRDKKDLSSCWPDLGFLVYKK